MDACAPSPETVKALDVTSFTVNLFSTDEILTLTNQRQSRQRTFPYYQYNMIVFKPSELNGCNVHGVENRMPLDTRNIDMIKEVVYQYFLTPPPSEHELLPHD